MEQDGLASSPLPIISIVTAIVLSLWSTLCTSLYPSHSPAQPSLSSVVAGGSVARVAVRSSRTQSDSGQEDKKGKAR